VTSIAELRKLLERAGNRFALLIQRGEARIFVPVRIEWRAQ
jgi:serine protease Do